MNVMLIGILAILCLYVFVGNYAGRKVETVEDYYVSGRKANTLLITGTITASALSTNCFLGDAGFIYEGYFIINVIFCLMMGCGHALGTLFYGRFIRRSKALTVADYFGKRFNSKRIQIAVAVVAIVACMSYLLAVTQGINLVLAEVTGINYKLCLVLTWFVYTSFTVYSGSRGVVLTDTMMFILFFAVTIIMIPFIIVDAVGEFSIPEIFKELAVFADKPGIVSYSSMISDWMKAPWQSLTWAVTVGLAWAIAMMVSPWQAGRYLMAKNEHTVLRSGILACFLVFIIQVLVYVGAISMNLINPNIDPTSSIFIWAAHNVLPIGIGVMLLSGIVSAGLSSASTFLSILGFSIVKDIMGKSTEGKSGVRYSQLVMLVTGLAVLIIALFMPLNIYWITIFAGTTIAASLGVASLMSVWSCKFTEKAAFWSIVAGLVINCSLKLLNNAQYINTPPWFDLFFVGLLASLVTALIVTKFTSVTDQEVRYRKSLFVVPEEEKNPAEMKRTIRYGYLLIAMGVLIGGTMILIYAIPYNSVA